MTATCTPEMPCPEYEQPLGPRAGTFARVQETMPSPRSHHAFRRRTQDAWLAGAGLIVFVLAAVAARNGRVDPAERAVFDAVNGLPDALSGPMTTLQYLGTLAIGPLVVVVALVLRQWRLAGAAAAVTVLKLALERGVKLVVHRQRPGTTVPDAVLRGDVPPRGWSFVSGHVILSGALAVIITPYLSGRWKVVPWIVVAAVSVARVYLGAHNPLDVVGGLGVGLFLGGAMNLAFGVPAAEERVAAAAG
jgi:membrane-associated phospholipid phosphatase